MASPSIDLTLYRAAEAADNREDFAQAALLLEGFLRQHPWHVEAIKRLGTCHLRMGQPERAEHYYLQALRQKPDFAAVHYNLGLIAYERGLEDEARRRYRLAVEADPRLYEAYNNLGLIDFEALDFSAALAEFERAAAIEPRALEPWHNRANTLRELGRLAESAAAFDALLAEFPGFARGWYDASHTYLLQGDFARGWAAHEQRLKLPDFALDLPGMVPWSGAGPLPQKLLICANQGIGDAVQFSRYVSLMARQGVACSVLCRPPLERFFARLDGVESVCVDQRDPLPPLATYCDLLSLPAILGTDATNIPPPSLAASVRDARTAGPLEVGLVWRGNPDQYRDRLRSLPLSELAPVLGVGGIRFHNLVIGAHGDETPAVGAGSSFVDDRDSIRDVADTMELIGRLDLVITVDTGIAHIAASIGKETWVLLAWVPDWRWLLERDDSPWYPTVRLFRQPRAGDWHSPVTAVAARLRARAGTPD